MLLVCDEWGLALFVSCYRCLGWTWFPDDFSGVVQPEPVKSFQGCLWRIGPGGTADRPTDGLPLAGSKRWTKLDIHAGGGAAPLQNPRAILALLNAGDFGDIYVEGQVAAAEQAPIGGTADLDGIVVARNEVQADWPQIGACGGIRGEGFQKSAALVEINHNILGNIVLPLDEILQTALPGFAAVGSRHLDHRRNRLE